MKARTSTTHPLVIATLELSSGGRIGMTFCPGKKDPWGMSGPWDRDLETDLAAIRAWNATCLVSLVENHELDHLGVPNLGDRAQAQGLTWYHLPIRDAAIPDASFEVAWRYRGRELQARLEHGEGVVVHCRGGLGRTGLVGARLLVELGEAPATALSRVRSARPGAVETLEQESYVLNQPSPAAE